MTLQFRVESPREPKVDAEDRGVESPKRAPGLPIQTRAPAKQCYIFLIFLKFLQFLGRFRKTIVLFPSKILTTLFKQLFRFSLPGSLYHENRPRYSVAP